jgi:signal transduction histidine kinase
MKRLFRVLLTAVVYYAAARIGLLLAFEGTNASPVWPPSGIAFALLVLLGRDVWPGILVGAFFSNLRVFFQNEAATPLVLLALSAAIACGNTLEGLAAIHLWNPRRAGDTSFARLSFLPRFVLSAMASCVIAANVGTLSLRTAGLTEHVSEPLVWLTWWLGDLVGMLVFTPLILTWATRSWGFTSWRRAGEAVLVVSALLATGIVGFGLRETPPDPYFTLAFLVMPPLVWASTRFGARGATGAVFLVSVMAMWATVVGAAPYGSAGVHQSLLLAQAYIGVLAVTHLALAAAVGELRSARRSLQEAAAGLEQRVTERTALAEHRAAQLRSLASELVHTEQRERRQLSRILHDHIQQLLVAAQLQLARLMRTRDLDDEHAQIAGKASALLSESVIALRDLSVRLSPPILHEQGLVAGLQWLARDMKAKYGLRVEVVQSASCERLDDTATLMAFEATRELLFNVTKHSGSHDATVRLEGDTDGTLRISVEDAGRGFDRGSIGPDSGQGLGLFSLSERIQALSGRVEVHTAPGEGTRVTLGIPSTVRTPARVISDVPPRDEPFNGPPSRHIRVLVADDHALFRQGIVSLLEREPGLRVVGQASDGAEAIRLAEELRPDVAVLDVNMPIMSGLEAARAIRNRFPEMRIIGVSMFADVEIADSMRAAGAYAYLSKDRASGELTALIRGPRPS